MSDQAIHAVRTTVVNVPLVAPYKWSVGYFPGFTKTIVEVETRSGAVGLGEAPSHWASRLIDEAIAPRLIGADPRDVADCERRALPPIAVLKNTEDDSLVRAYGGVEMALWDLAGKLSARSVADLLGGRVRDRVAFTEYFSVRLAKDGSGGESSPADVARYCADMAETYGSTSFEGKVGIGSLGFEIEMVKGIRSAIGDDALLRLDANMGWSLMTAREALRRLEPFNVRSVEDPVRGVEDMVRLRPHTSISFSSHDPNLFHAVRVGAPDAIVLNLAVLGGIRRTVAFVNAAEHFGIDVWFYSPDTGVANAAYLQVAAALEWISQPSQTLLRWHGDDVIAGGPFVPRNGGLDVPTGPGLGVELDAAALRRCHEAFLRDGPSNQYFHPARPDRYGPRHIFLEAGT